MEILLFSRVDTQRSVAAVCVLIMQRNKDQRFFHWVAVNKQSN